MPKKSSESAKGLAKREILGLLKAGQTPIQIQEHLGLNADSFEVMLREAMDELAQELSSQPTEHVFARHFIEAVAIINKLDKFTTDSGIPREAINALKAQYEIRKDLLRLAKEFGIVNIQGMGAEAGLPIYIAQHIQGMTATELRSELARSLDELVRIQREVGDDDILALPEQRLHHGDSIYDIQGAVKSEE